MSKVGYRQKCLDQKPNECDACGSPEGLVVHHINGDRYDDRLENLVPLCRPCHGAVHISPDVSGRVEELQDRLPESAKDWDVGVDSHGPEPIDESDFRNPSPRLNETKRAIVEVLRSTDSAQRHEIISKVGRTGGTVDKNLRNLRIAGWVERVERGVYQYVPPSGGDDV